MTCWAVQGLALFARLRRLVGACPGADNLSGFHCKAKVELWTRARTASFFQIAGWFGDCFEQKAGAKRESWATSFAMVAYAERVFMVDRNVGRDKFSYVS